MISYCLLKEEEKNNEKEKSSIIIDGNHDTVFGYLYNLAVLKSIIFCRFEAQYNFISKR